VKGASNTHGRTTFLTVPEPHASELSIAIVGGDTYGHAWLMMMLMIMMVMMMHRGRRHVRSCAGC
jgi:hypothetical protein